MTGVTNMVTQARDPPVIASTYSAEWLGSKKGAAKRPYRGKMRERARDRRVSRDIAGEECGEVSMGGADVFITRPEAPHPRPQPDGSAGHARTRSEGVATQEAEKAIG
ncbi:MAG: hypothetical protein WCJ02_01955 [bacterium]